MEAKIILVYDDQREAEAVVRAVSPDNVKVPPYLSIETTRSDIEVVTRVRCVGNRLGTFISTIDDFLSCASVAEKVFSTVKGLM